MEHTMNVTDSLIQRNAEFAREGFTSGLKMLPSRRTMIIGCVDPRVDPMDIFQLEPGEAAIIRNVGGRVNPALLETMAILGTVTRAAGEEVGTGWNLVVLHHTDCGIKGCYQHAPELLAKQMGVPLEGLDALAINDPYQAVALDVAALKANPRLPGGFTVTGLVYDVANGLVQTIVPPALLRP
jgi:carbonic anhydrase